MYGAYTYTQFKKCAQLTLSLFLLFPTVSFFRLNLMLKKEKERKEKEKTKHRRKQNHTHTHARIRSHTRIVVFVCEIFSVLDFLRCMPSEY